MDEGPKQVQKKDEQRTYYDTETKAEIDRKSGIGLLRIPAKNVVQRDHYEELAQYKMATFD